MMTMMVVACDSIITRNVELCFFHGDDGNSIITIMMTVPLLAKGHEAPDVVEVAFDD